MKDLIDNLADHLGLNVLYYLHEDADICVYRMIGGWQYRYCLHEVSVGPFLEQWLQIANDHMDAVEGMDVL